MNFMRLSISFLTALFIGLPSMNMAMVRALQASLSQQRAIVNPFFSNTRSIDALRQVMDGIEQKNLGYDDYSSRTGLIWSDVEVNTLRHAHIVRECQSTKVTEVRGKLATRDPESILSYPAAQSIVSTEILPTMFERIRAWTQLPETVFIQIFFQRCSTSEAMAWHQDPGEDYDPQANYSLVLMLSDQADAKHGWTGGEFKIRSGLPEDNYDEACVDTITPRYNQGIIFNNQQNSHSTTEVVPNGEKAKRDIIVILLTLNKLPLKK